MGREEDGECWGVLIAVEQEESRDERVSESEEEG